MYLLACLSEPGIATGASSMARLWIGKVPPPQNLHVQRQEGLVGETETKVTINTTLDIRKYCKDDDKKKWGDVMGSEELGIRSYFIYFFV